VIKIHPDEKILINIKPVRNGAYFLRSHMSYVLWIFVITLLWLSVVIFNPNNILSSSIIKNIDSGYNPFIPTTVSRTLLFTVAALIVFVLYFLWNYFLSKSYQYLVTNQRCIFCYGRHIRALQYRKTTAYVKFNQIEKMSIEQNKTDQFLGTKTLILKGKNIAPTVKIGGLKNPLLNYDQDIIKLRGLTATNANKLLELINRHNAA